MEERVVLVTDDDPDVRSIFRTILEDRGFSVLVAASGTAAVRLARRHHPDLIFMDLMMPAMSGWEAAAALKAAGGEVAKIPVVAVTALEPDPESIRGARFCAVLTKPVAPLSVVKAADICLEEHARGESWIADLARRITEG
ncbi:MAG: response regulator [Gemmatimonadetes bacterium]|nr:response regulator [Gemmatimonadota bacterium]